MKALTVVFILFFMNEVFAQSQRYKFFKDQRTTIRNPFDMRDPFKKNIKRKRIKKGGTFAKYGNTYSNLPKLGETPLKDIRIVGITLGENRTALAKVVNGDKLGDESFLLKEGMSLGENEAVIRAILPGGLVVVEKILNVYDEYEYLETVIPLTVN